MDKCRVLNNCEFRIYKVSVELESLHTARMIRKAWEYFRSMIPKKKNVRSFYEDKFCCGKNKNHSSSKDVFAPPLAGPIKPVFSNMR